MWWEAMAGTVHLASRPKWLKPIVNSPPVRPNICKPLDHFTLIFSTEPDSPISPFSSTKSNYVPEKTRKT